jgi:predicted aspartyl protease
MMFTPPLLRQLGRRSGLATVTLLALVVSGLPAAAITAPDENCYLVTASGQRIGLNQLCGELPTAPPKGGVARAKIKRRIAAIPVIDVTFNGGPTFEMIVDTGASSTLITQGMADQLQIQPARIVRAGIADGSVVQFPTGFVRSMAVGTVTARNVEVTIADRMNIGLLGHDFFGNYDVKIKQDVIEFYPRS